MFQFDAIEAADEFRAAALAQGFLADEIHEFKMLPFVTAIPGASDIRTMVQPIASHRYYPGAYARLLAGLDFLISDRIDAINLSLTPDDDLPDDDPIVHAIEHCLQLGNQVVVAAGNSGPHGDIQPLAKIPGVFSSGAVGKDKRLLDSSSRGPEGGWGPTVVSWGDPQVLYIKEDWPLPESMTSYASPRVTRVIVMLTKLQQLLWATYSKVPDAWDNSTAAVPVSVIGFADTGIDPNAIGPLPKRVADALERSEFVSFSLDDRHKRWFDCLREKAADLPMTGVSTLTILSCLESIAVPLDGYGPHEIGAGFVSRVECWDLLTKLTPTRFVRLFSPGVAGDEFATRNEALDAELGVLFTTAEIQMLFEFFYDGALLRIARVV